MKVEKDNYLSSSKSGKKHHHHAGHGWMMALCIGILLVAFLGVWVFGTSIPTTDLLFLLLCPIVMGVMMWVMGQGQERGEGEPIKAAKVSKSGVSQPEVRPNSSEQFSSWEA